MRFDIITIFPAIFDSYFNESILRRAQKNKFIEIYVHNLRDYAIDKHHTTDDTPYGGGAGMVMKVEPIYNCVNAVKSQIPNPNFQKNPKTRIILFSAKGQRYTQADARRLSKYDNLILICGRYEGVDERVAKYIADEEISIGDYVLTGGEIPAMIVADSVSRLVPGVLGNSNSLNEESFSPAKIQSASRRTKFNPPAGGQNSFLEHPHYTKPEEFLVQGGVADGKTWKVPKILLSGNHAAVEKWREEHSVN